MPILFHPRPSSFRVSCPYTFLQSSQAHPFPHAEHASPHQRFVARPQATHHGSHNLSLLRRWSPDHPLGGVKFSGLTKNDLPRVSDQAQRFVLLTYLLRRVGMCSPDISACLARYIKTLPVVKLSQLKQYFPHCESKIVHDPAFIMPTTLNGLVDLGDPAVLTSTALADPLRAALLHFAESPSWAYGVNGFFLWTATKTSRIPIKGAPRSSGPTTGSWLGELENAVWVAAMSRAIVLTHGNKKPIPVLTRQALREGFYTLFNMTKDTKHFAESCVCKDKVFAFEHESYHEEIYTENVLPLPAVAADDDDLELRKIAIKRNEVNLVETLDRLIWPEMDREAAAEALRRDSKRPKDAVPTEPVDLEFWC